MFGLRKEAPVDRWQAATWDHIPGYAQNTQGEKRHNKEWDFSVILLPEIDPSSVVLGYSNSTDGNGTYTVSAKFQETLCWTLLRLHERSNRGNYLNNFRVHATLEDLKEVVGPGNINPTDEILKL